jgi:predicted acetyltransferase
MELILPTVEHLDSYVAALEKGWSPDTARGAAAARELLDEVQREGPGMLARMDDPQALGPPVKLPDGSTVARLPGTRRWIWDGEFCGSIGLRWQPGTAALPPHCLGHIGYAVVPWKRRRGHARRALSLMLPLARAEGLPFVQITTDPDNVASQRVIAANGGTLVEEFAMPPNYGRARGLRYQIDLGA